jgi:ATP-dependent Lhr-like helicase
LRWCSRRLVEQARRRALAAARKQVEAVSFETFALFMQRWQHVHPEHRWDAGSVTQAMEQLYGVSRHPLSWIQEILPARVRDLQPTALSQLGASGEMLWAGEGVARGDAPAAAGRLRHVRFVRRGTERAWLAPIETPVLGPRALAVRELLANRGALFFYELQQGSGLGPHALRDALRELVVAGLVTNDTIDALARVARWRPLFGEQDAAQDPARWLPADFVPSSNRPVVQRRVNLRRIPKWKRPDREGGDAPWPGRWSLIDRAPAAAPAREQDESAHAAMVASQWLERYGVVARDWWRREKPPIPWRAIYRELRRMEMRGDVRRGYFVTGLAGAQFAHPAAVEELRASVAADRGIVVITVADPANVWTLPSADSFARPRNARTLLVTQGGRVIMTSDPWGRAVAVRDDLPAEEITAAVSALLLHIRERRPRDLIIETINGQRASTSAHAPAFRAAGLRLTSRGLRYYASFERG